MGNRQKYDKIWGSKSSSYSSIFTFPYSLTPQVTLMNNDCRLYSSTVRLRTTTGEASYNNGKV
uniref:Uncharacterized protein n=1 Tax=Cucumis melo TaxID=3656 RepID=A0A9I9CX02_CUCME